MARKHFKRNRRTKEKVAAEVKPKLEIKPEPKQISRGESIRPAVFGGYKHSFFYEYTIYGKGERT